MIYDKVINGKFVSLRSITTDDAEFSYNIRADVRNRDTVGQLAPSLEAQRAYIEKQIETPNDYYFVVLNKRNERIGLIGVYDIHDDMGEVGREVNIGEPTETMETTLLIDDFCKDVLKLKKLCYVIYANNKKNLSNAKKKKGNMVGKIIRSGVEAYYFEDDIDSVDERNIKIRKMIDRLADRK